jgi:NADP-dependent 3-hydroxy acid dehydrogenase YdfG
MTLARGLCEAGARVAVNARDAERTAAAARALRDDGFDALACPFDVTDAQQVADGLAEDRIAFAVSGNGPVGREARFVTGRLTV